MSNIVKKKQYDFVNLAKFISAVFVIGIHTSPLQGLHPKLNYFTRCIVFRLAVPFFFICSGYLYQKYSRIKNILDWKNNIIN